VRGSRNSQQISQGGGLSNIVIKEILRKKGLSEPSAAARRAGCRSPGDRHHQAFAAPGRYPTLVGRDFRVAPTHGGCALAAVTDRHHGQPLGGDHLHHGLLTSESY